MTIAPFMRRWGALVLGSVFLLIGVAVLCTHLTFGFDWDAYAPMSDMAFYPGLPSTRSAVHSGAEAMSSARYAALGGQISLVLGVTLLAGWVGFSLSRSSMGRSSVVLRSVRR